MSGVRRICPRRRYEAAKILLDVSRVVVSSLEPDRVSELVLKELTLALGADHASLFLIDEGSPYLILQKALGFSKDELDNIKLLGSWEVINEEVIKKHRPLVVNNIYKNPVFRSKILPFLHEKLPVRSFMAAPLERDGKIIGVLIVSNRKRPGHSFTKEDKELVSSLSNHIAIALINAKLYKRLKDLFISTVASLAKTIEAKDPYTGGHSERVMKYAVAIGKEMGLQEEVMENVRLSSLLHDIGKVGIKDDILLKTGDLSVLEREEIYRHPLIGAKIVETIADSHNIIRGILEHHERYGGGGYPHGLKGDAISLEARIIAVADAYDALTSDRPYQKRYLAKEVYHEIIKGSSIRFDPKVVKAFKQSYKKYPSIWKV